LDRLGSVLILNLLWLICSIPVLTVGAATAAAYQTSRKYVLKGEGGILAVFFTAFKANIKQATILGLAGILIGAIDILTVGAASGGLLAIGFPLLIGGIFLACLFFWCIPLATRFTNSTFAHFRNGFSLGLGHIGRTLLLLAGLVVAGMGIWRYLPLVFVLPTGVMVLWTYYLERLFQKLGYVAPGPVASWDIPSEIAEDEDAKA